MKNIAIVGTGPTGIYTFFSLLKFAEQMSISIYEKEDEAGVGMPYNDDENSRMSWPTSPASRYHRLPRPISTGCASRTRRVSLDTGSTRKIFTIDNSCLAFCWANISGISFWLLSRQRVEKDLQSKCTNPAR